MGLNCFYNYKTIVLPMKTWYVGYIKQSKNGVKVKLIVRGICSLIPQLPQTEWKYWSNQCSR